MSTGRVVPPPRLWLGIKRVPAVPSGSCCPPSTQPAERPWAEEGQTQTLRPWRRQTHRDGKWPWGWDGARVGGSNGDRASV